LQRDETFVWIVETIRRCVYEEIYEGHFHTVLKVNGTKYWTTGALIEETILITRK
jgi:hypothetical protein